MTEQSGNPEIVNDDKNESSWLTTKEITWGETGVYDHTNKIKREYDGQNRLLYIEKEKDGTHFLIEYKYETGDEYGLVRVSDPKNKIYHSEFGFEIWDWGNTDLTNIRIDHYKPDLILNVIDFAVEIADHKGLQNFGVSLLQQDKQTGQASDQRIFRGRILDNEVLCLNYATPLMLENLQKLTRVYKTAENEKN